MIIEKTPLTIEYVVAFTYNIPENEEECAKFLEESLESPENVTSFSTYEAAHEYIIYMLHHVPIYKFASIFQFIFDSEDADEREFRNAFTLQEFRVEQSSVDKNDIEDYNNCVISLDYTDIEQ